jgi:hypothetical protein
MRRVKGKIFTEMWIKKGAILIALLLFIAVGAALLAQGKVQKNRNNKFGGKKLALLSDASLPYFLFSTEDKDLTAFNLPSLEKSSSVESSSQSSSSKKNKTETSLETSSQKNKENKGKPIAQADTKAPKVTLTASPEEPDGENGWYTSSLFITLKTNEPATIFYSFDSGDVKSAQDEVELEFPQGVHTLTYYAIDEAGNKSEEEKATYKVDLLDPIAEIDFPIKDEVYSSSFYVIGTADDDNFTQYTLELGKDGNYEVLSKGNSPVVNDVLGFVEEEGRKGSFTLKLTVSDESGRTSEKVVSFVIDNGPPLAPEQLFSCSREPKKQNLSYSLK